MFICLLSGLDSVYAKSDRASAREAANKKLKTLTDKWGWPGDFNKEESKLMNLSFKLESEKLTLERWPELVAAARKKSKT